jgi:catechol 2,3-dioxygenase-like lactoylglutathione lyase family enzyme
MSDDAKNVFQRRESQEPITDLTKNAFERNRDAIAARNAAAAATAVDTKRIKDDAQNHFDVTHRRGPTGTVMDPALAAASKNYHADQLARRKQATSEVRGVTSLLALRAMIEFWQRNADSAVNFYESEFNYTSLTNCFVTRVFGRHQAPTPETVSHSYFECLEGNHLELPRAVDANGGIVRRRGQAQPIPPTLYPRFAWPQEEAAARDAEVHEALAVMLGTSARRKAEEAAARKTPLAEQQKQVRANYKPDAVPRDVIGSGVL